MDAWLGRFRRQKDVVTRTVELWLLGLSFMAAGVNHFLQGGALRMDGGEIKGV